MVEQPKILKHHTQFPAQSRQGFSRAVDHVSAEHVDAAACGFQRHEQKPEQAGLARSRSAREKGEIACPH